MAMFGVQFLICFFFWGTCSCLTACVPRALRVTARARRVAHAPGRCRASSPRPLRLRIGSLPPHVHARI
jgi:hypothetical protein